MEVVLCREAAARQDGVEFTCVPYLHAQLVRLAHQRILNSSDF